MFEIWRNSFGSLEIVQSDMNTLGGESSFVSGGFETWESASAAVGNMQAASRLGSIKTERKAASSRENGRKGGRPRK